MGWFDSLFGGGADEGYDEASELLGKSEQMLKDYLTPYMNNGNMAQPGLSQQYGVLMNNPGSKINEWGAGFQQSPGYQFQMDQAMNAANSAASAGGMLGTPAHSQEAMRYASGLADQEYDDYINRLMGLYGQGLQGNQGMYNTGYNATNQLAGGLGNIYGSQANMAMSKGQSQDNMMSSLLGAGLTAGGYALGNYLAPGVGGTMGATAGQALGNGLFGSNDAGKNAPNFEPWKANSNWMGGY